MDVSTALLLAGSGLAAGLVNAIAGGGTFFTFSAMVAAGLPPVVANATSSVAVTPGNLSSIWAYRQELRRFLRRFVGLAVVSFLGGAVGAYILTETDNTSFSRLVPWLLLFATLLFMASPKIVALARTLGRHEAQHPSTLARSAGLAFQFLVAIYGGFFGAGMGIVMLAALAITEGDDFHVINSAKHLCATLIQLVAVVLFILAGLVSWPDAVLMAAASVVGGYLGVVFGRKLPAPVIRWLVIAVGAFLTVYFFIR
jgi:uncharacterized protein